MVIPHFKSRSFIPLPSCLKLLYFLPQHLDFLIRHHILFCHAIVVNFESHSFDVGLQLLNSVFSLFQSIFEFEYFYLRMAVMQSEIMLLLLVRDCALL